MKISKTKRKLSKLKDGDRFVFLPSMPTPIYTVAWLLLSDVLVRDDLGKAQSFTNETLVYKIID